MSLLSAADRATASHTVKVGCVSYLNAKPLIYGLEDAADIQLLLDVPSHLADGLADGRFDVALLPVIDYQRLPGLCLLPASGIACDGPTLTVRIFSPKPIASITRLACDSDSHTSVALARVILAQAYGIHPEFTAWRGGMEPADDAILLIGDKVVCQEPAGFDHQLDLGEAWKELTGLPFVFAVWMAKCGCNLGRLPQLLETARQRGLSDIESIIRNHAIPRGWPPAVAHRYLTDYLKYDIGPQQLKAIRTFHDLAARQTVLELPLQPLRIYRQP